MSEYHGLVQRNTLKLKLEAPQPVNWRTGEMKSTSGTGVVIKCFGSRFLVTSRHLFYDTTKDDGPSAKVERSREEGLMAFGTSGRTATWPTEWLGGLDWEHEKGGLSDISIARIDRKQLSRCRGLACRFEMPVGEAVEIKGFPLDSRTLETVPGELVQWVERTQEDLALARMQANALKFGMSGGPVVDRRGGCLGVVSGVPEKCNEIVRFGKLSTIKSLLADLSGATDGA